MSSHPDSSPPASATSATVESADNAASQEIDPDHATPDSESGADTTEISKSERKREAERITQLGKTISELGEPDIRRLPLDDAVLDAVLTLRSITTRGARKRQLLYLGKLLRKSDLGELERGLAQLQQAAKTANQHFHAVEAWRDQLLQDGPDALSEFVRQYPECDRQRLRQLLRNARREQELNKPPKSSRELFKHLRDIMS